MTVSFDKKDRNKRAVGKNSASYNAKHPHNPIELRPVSLALAKHGWSPARARRIRKLQNLPRPELLRALKNLGWQ